MLRLQAANGLQPTPQLGEWWLLCVGDFDPEFRNEEEEYYGTISKMDSIANGFVYTVEDLGENDEAENNVPLSRCILNMCAIVLVC